MKVKVITDSGSGLSRKEAESLGLDYFPLQVLVEEKIYNDGVDLTTEELYELLEKGYLPKTSMTSLGYIEEAFDKYEKDGVTDVILITLSSGLSGMNSAVQVCALEHGIKIHTLDICTTLAAQKYWAICAFKLAEDGVACSEIINRIRESVEHSKGYLMPENMDHLARGGRLSATAAKLAGMLKIIPILEVSKDTGGKVGKDADKVRTMSKAIKKQCKIIAKDTKNSSDYKYFILNSNSKDYAKIAVEELKSMLGDDIDVEEDLICAVIASHTGTGAVGIQYVKKVRGVEI